MNSFDLGVNYAQHRKTLLASASRILGNREWAEDVLNDTFVYLIEEPQEHDPSKSAPLTWLANIVNRRCLNALRERKVENARRAASCTHPEYASSPAKELEAVEDEVERATSFVRINEWLESDTRTPLAIRNAIRSHYMEGVDISVLARGIGISRHTLVRQMDAALLRWRKRLEREVV